MGRFADSEQIGVGVEIHPTAEFVNVEHLKIGDHSYIGPGVRVIGGSLDIGEYSKIHNDCYIYPKRGITLGNCTWIGQGTHLDGTGGIRAGDFLGVGINSALYSHIRHGDITEGCAFEKDSFLDIGDDVWFVGMCLVSPIVAASKSMAFLGSVVTRDMDENRVYGGNPAKDITQKVGAPWKEISVDEKLFAVQSHIEQYFREINPRADRSLIVVSDRDEEIQEGQTLYNVSARTYRKTNSVIEVQLNKWLFGYRAKFRPVA